MHTPGPWRVLYGDTIDAPSRTVAKLYFGNRGQSKEDDEANAKLIAAAPDLLSVVQDVIEIHDMCECRMLSLPEGECLRCLALAAYNKATGTE